MKFSRVSDETPVVDYLTQVLTERLSKGGKVLWLVPGGSAIGVAAQVAKKIRHFDLSSLTVTLTDERYGEVGHSDSNWRQLHEADFHLPGAMMVPILHGHKLDDTTTEFARHLQEYCKGAAYCLGFFGMGPDGHTAGILPDSSAATATEWAVAYETPQYLRVTMTPPAIAALDEIVVYAMGEAKQEPLERLKEDVSVEEQPAQALKQVTKLTIFNDQIGETA